jgi:hypothetical protein
MLPHSVTIPDGFAEPRMEVDRAVLRGKLKCAWSSVPGNPSAGELFAFPEPGIYAYQLSATE